MNWVKYLGQAKNPQKGVALAERSYRHLTENFDLRLQVQAPANAGNFANMDCKKINKGSPVRVIMVCSDESKVHRLTLYCTRRLLLLSL